MTQLTSSALYLRPATVADWPQLVALDQAIFGSYGADEDPAIIRARLVIFPAGCCVMAEEAGKIVGYVTTEKWHTRREPALDEDPAHTHQPAGRVLNITTLAVSPNYQNRGIGQQLLAAVIAIAQQEACTEIVLETARAAAFYRRHGFTKHGERIQRGIVLHIMTLALNGAESSTA